MVSLIQAHMRAIRVDEFVLTFIEYLSISHVYLPLIRRVNLNRCADCLPFKIP